MPPTHNCIDQVFLQGNPEPPPLTPNPGSTEQVECTEEFVITKDITKKNIDIIEVEEVPEVTYRTSMIPRTRRRPSLGGVTRATVAGASLLLALYLLSVLLFGTPFERFQRESLNLSAILAPMRVLSPIEIDHPADSGDGLPLTLTQQQLTQGIQDVSETIQDCVEAGNPILVDLQISGSTGRVISSRVRGPLDGTPEGICVARAIEQARFPRFSEPTFEVRRFPVSLP